MRRRRHATSRLRIPALVLLALAGAACDRGDPQVGAWTVSPEPTVRIGRVTGDDAYVFQEVRTARFLPDGRIAVADAGRRAVRIYSPEGDFRQDLGGRGRGPGEFGSVDGLWLTPDGGLRVWDAANRRITTFTAGGDLAGTAPVRPGDEIAAGNLEVHLGTFSDGDVLLAALRPGARAGGQQVVPDRWLLGRFGPDGRLEARLGEVRGMRRRGGRPVPTSPVPDVVVLGDSIYAADGYAAAVAVRDGSGDSVRALRLPAEERSAEEAWAAFEAELGRRGDSATIRLLDSGEVPTGDPFPRVAGLLADDRGHLWVKEFRPAADALALKRGSAMWTAPGGTWRVVRSDGRVVAEVAMPADVTPLQISGDRLLGVEVGELDVERIVVHSIDR